MQLISRESPSHWYYPDGKCCHTVEKKDGSGPRPTTLADARKLGLYPSVTNILNVISKPELTAWLQEQAILASLTLPRIDGESQDDFAKRAVKDAEEYRDKAAGFGTAFHAGAEALSNRIGINQSDPVKPWLDKYKEWMDDNISSVVWSELRLVSTAHGYAGTADMLAHHKDHGLVLVDIKTQGIKPGKKPEPYKSWLYQLAAYWECLDYYEADAKLMNLIIDSTHPCEPIEHLWSGEEANRGVDAFLSAYQIWRIQKDYNPTEARK